ncbi:helix-turn-helix transcriptional regulator [Lactobacillus helveticus]|nr:XRE family transcriptional regulator [Lactobacillus helveticus]MZR06708.1 hypothetical protein [Lactobacillus helveticus]NAS34742.1 hypothetical protein [Lactobacillus helveticus]PTS33733.1 XRE family transcriptional regulator [Lactobacillus helveticus]PTS33857.1 XRE family transcriptional regulator [Lactobacillus helveticus]
MSVREFANSLGISSSALTKIENRDRKIVCVRMNDSLN